MISVLQIGELNWQEKISFGDNIEFFCEDEIEYEKKIYDITIISRNLTSEDVKLLLKMSSCYRVFFTDNFSVNEITQEYFLRQCAQLLPEAKVQKFFDEEAKKYFGYTYGEKLDIRNIGIKQGFLGKVIYHGNTALELEGDFGRDFSQLINYKVNMPIDKNNILDFWFEYEKDESVEIYLNVKMITSGSVDDVNQIINFSEQDLQNVIQIENKKQKSSYTISVFARGKGKFKFIGFHTRHSRVDKGCIMVGADRYVTSKREEVFCYFEPGDFKPPLTVYFSGYKTKEGYEGYYMMKNLGTPFLLVAEQRLEGGAFYIGDDEYEKMVSDAILKYLDRLGFSHDQLILSGISMGSTGAMYYGAGIKPHALILGKPLANLGNIALHEKIERPTGFPTSLDLMMKNTGGVSNELVEVFNNRFWNKFESADWQETKIIVSHLYEDDYDNDAYNQLLRRLNSSGVQIYSKGTHGRHNDNSATVAAWFKGQYNKILREDFGRVI